MAPTQPVPDVRRPMSAPVAPAETPSLAQASAVISAHADIPTPKHHSSDDREHSNHTADPGGQQFYGWASESLERKQTSITAKLGSSASVASAGGKLMRHLSHHFTAKESMAHMPHSFRTRQRLATGKYDVDDDGDEFPPADVSPYVIRQANTKRVVFDLCGVVVIFYVAMVEPARSAFEQGDNYSDDCPIRDHDAKAFFRLTDWIVTLFFIMDLVLNFFTTFTDFNGNEVFDLIKIRRHYVRGWFFLDLFTTLMPIFDAAGLSQNAMFASNGRLLKMGRLFKLFKILRIAKMMKIADSAIGHWIDEVLESSEAVFSVAMLRVLGMFIVVAHWLACFMIYVDNMSEPNSGFLISDDNALIARSTDSCRNGYITAMYWAVTTMTTVGYGDITPTNALESTYCMAAMVIGGFIYGYIISVISSIVASSDANDREYNERMGTLASWLKYHKMPENVRRNVRSYFKAYFREHSALNENNILDGLAPGLREEVCQYVVPACIRQAPLFVGIPVSFLAKIAPIMWPVTYEQGAMLQEEGGNGSELHLVASGKCRAVYMHRGSNNHLLEGDCFGVLVGLGVHFQYDCSVYASSFVALYMMSRDQLLEKVAMLPEVTPALLIYLLLYVLCLILGPCSLPHSLALLPALYTTRCCTSSAGMPTCAKMLMRVGLRCGFISGTTPTTSLGYEP